MPARRRGRLDFDVLHSRVRGAAPQRRLEPRERLFVPFRDDFDTAIRLIANAPRQPFAVRNVLREKAKSDALHTPAHDVAARYAHLTILLHRRCSHGVPPIGSLTKVHQGSFTGFLHERSVKRWAGPARSGSLVAAILLQDDRIVVAVHIAERRIGADMNASIGVHCSSSSRSPTSAQIREPFTIGRRDDSNIEAC
jgi:hypothetical protein